MTMSTGQIAGKPYVYLQRRRHAPPERIILRERRADFLAALVAVHTGYDLGEIEDLRREADFDRGTVGAKHIWCEESVGEERDKTMGKQGSLRTDGGGVRQKREKRTERHGAEQSIPRSQQVRNLFNDVMHRSSCAC
ncbi:hypothetical protein FGB62_14g243 [Gracilaria domingensis]|nr:hypothetical protein FGB62_14g243 [Gracilaria domingensis]